MRPYFDLNRLSLLALFGSSVLTVLFLNDEVVLRDLLVQRQYRAYLLVRLAFWGAAGLLVIRWWQSRRSLDWAQWALLVCIFGQGLFGLVRTSNLRALGMTEFRSVVLALLGMEVARDDRLRRWLLWFIVGFGILNVATAVFPPEELVAIRQSSLGVEEVELLEDWRSSISAGYRNVGLYKNSAGFGVACAMAAILAFPVTRFRVFRLLLTGVAGFGILLSVNRGAILGAAIAAGIMVLISLRLDRISLAGLVRVGVVLSVFVTTAMLLWPEIPYEARDVILTRFRLVDYDQADTLASGIDDRMSQMRGAAGIIADSPLLGVDRIVEEMILRGAPPAVPHNWVVSLASRRGLPFTLLVCVILGAALARGIRREWLRADAWSLNQVAAILAALGGDFFHHRLMPLMWLLVGVCLVPDVDPPGEPAGEGAVASGEEGMPPGGGGSP